jgi:multidrug efflux pump subunit AcrB
MKLPKTAIQNHEFTLMFFIVLLFLGVYSLVTMPRSEDPPMDLPGASVFVIYPGGNPADLEELIAIPIEEAINELEDVKVINTSIKDGMVAISVEFTFETDPVKKFDEVLRQVNNTRSSLPDGIYDLRIFEWSSTDVVMLQLAFVSETSGLMELNDEAEDLKKKLERIKGVRMVEVFAAPEVEVRISLDFQKMAALGLSVEDVSNAIQSNNANIPGGEIDIGERTFNLKTSGSYASLAEIENTVVSSFRGSLVYLKDIAEVAFTLSDLIYIARSNGNRSIFLTVKQKEGLNIFSLNREIAPVVDEFRRSLPPGINLEVIFDQTQSVDHRINGFFMNLLQGIALVGLFIFLSLGFRASVLVIIAIPLSILIGLGWVDLAGFGLQQISIAALVIALGLLVDNSIVITENIERLIRGGMGRRDAAAEGTSQLGWPIVSATLTTMFAFIPIIAMPDKAGRFIQSLPVTVLLTLFASLLIALTLTPYLASIFFKEESQMRAEQGSRALIKKLVSGPYHKTLDFVIGHRRLVYFLAIVALALTGWLASLVGVSFFPKAEKPQFLVRVDMPAGSSLEKTDKVARYVESVLDSIPDVKHYASNVGHGNPRIYYNTFPRQYDRAFAEVFVELVAYDAFAFNHLIDSLREVFGRYPMADIQIKEFEQGNPVEAPMTIKITGERLEELAVIAGEVQSWAEAIPGLVNVDNNLQRVNTELRLDINREKAGMYGVPVHSIDLTVRAAVAGTQVSSYQNEEGKSFPIVLRLPEGDSLKISDLQKIYLKSMFRMPDVSRPESFKAGMVPLSQLASLEFRESPGLISRYNLMRDATITADVRRGYSLDDAVEVLDEKLAAYPWPEGYTYKFTGEVESREESFGGMAKAGILAILAIFAVLVLQFRSFRQPLIIFSAVPLGLIGSTLALFITGNTFSFTAFIGLISLVGIVVNNSIIMVDYTNVLRQQGRSLEEAVKEAGETRFTPIMLTTLTTVGGLLPLTLQGGTLWAPMGWTIIGGLLVSTLLTLVMVPVLYVSVEKKRGVGSLESL